MQEQSTSSPLLLSAREAAKTLGISERHLFAQTKSGEIPAVRLGRRVLYSTESLHAWIRSQSEPRTSR